MGIHVRPALCFVKDGGVDGNIRKICEGKNAGFVFYP